MKWSLDQLRTFLCVADTGGFSRAGERLFLAQSTVSWQIQQLERQVGTPLLQRSPDGVTLTEKGMAFYLKVQGVITANDDVESWLRQDAGTRKIIRFATTDCYASCLLSGVLQYWKERFPDIQVSVDCSFSADIWKRFRKGEIDIALAQHCPADICAEPIRVEPLNWVCARQTSVWQQNTVPIALFEQGCPDRDIMLNALRGAGREYQVEFETYSFGGLVAAVESGAVVSALPRSTIPSTLKSLNEKHRFPRLPSLNVKLAKQRRNSNSVCSQFYDAIVLHLAENSTKLGESHTVTAG